METREDMECDALVRPILSDDWENGRRYTWNRTARSWTDRASVGW